MADSSPISEILIVDDDTSFAASAAELARAEGYSPRLARSVAEGRIELDSGSDLLLLDLKLPDGSGLELLPWIDPALHRRVAILTGNPSFETATRAVGGLVSDYLVKPFDPAVFISLLRESRNIAKHVVIPSDEPIPGVIATSAVMRESTRLARTLAATDASILLTGESGTGKALFARAIHTMSGCSGAFVTLDCGSMPAQMLADSLIGGVPHAGNQTRTDAPGAIDRAAGGTLFLADISEMSFELQGYLLRLLENDEAHVGQPRPGSAPRIIASTRLDLQTALADGRLRDDLYYRIAEVHIPLPPLRQRGDDIVLLARRMTQAFNLRYDLDKRLSSQSIRNLLAHPWPGNFRELRNAVHRAYLLASGEEILVVTEVRRLPPPVETRNTVAFSLGTPWAEMERRMLLKALAHCDNDKTAAARLLGVSVRTVHNHLSRMRDDVGD
ncbi:sigma 54-interacting transcriptional regulator [Luteimonas fraxinea]|uniref:Sigma 54-interacting transcriptional regulator n=1 Tax=Luteimonas fraxinea TaxID=2901869 RepID=A0ABS8UEZ1_9GAMM|nr:sigma 54-interacting transcriptional regulator [Luteimonas fraxinea]MCD9097306.1 sigma 54-interacting transcriptional regulator [Luteimonas fraxinea]MCD9125130.1 sigma 54-interacting transcriptional regulator [Luteimonas fraxinea]UHH11567.1 sigma 54-interacting transcriptional regulator [Luteimonas fraxinea]